MIENTVHPDLDHPQPPESYPQDDDDELEGYSFVKTLGKGNFSQVKLGIHVLTGQHVAIKILEKDLIFEKADIERISRQIKIMKLIRHPNIIQLYQILETPKRLYLIMQYAQGGDLFQMITQNQKLTDSQSANYFSQIIHGLQYLHSRGVAHRDMKPENILISGDRIKIADFGLSNFFKENQLLKTACGSPCYASPEMLERLPYDPQKIDIWSSGVILYAMVCQCLPFEDENTVRLYQKIKTKNPKFPKFMNQQLKQLLKRILDKNPETRIKIPEMKTNPWLKVYFEPTVEQFQVEIKKLNKICKIYGINDKQKLIGYLQTNKHNNLTTIYYLASKNSLDDGSEGNSQEKFDDVNGEDDQGKKEDNAGGDEVMRDQKIIEEYVNNSVASEQSHKFTFQLANLSPTTPNSTPPQPHSNQLPPQSSCNSNSIKNQISFKHLEEFSQNGMFDEFKQVLNSGKQDGMAEEVEEKGKIMDGKKDIQEKQLNNNGKDKDNNGNLCVNSSRCDTASQKQKKITTTAITNANNPISKQKSKAKKISQEKTKISEELSVSPKYEKQKQKKQDMRYSLQVNSTTKPQQTKKQQSNNKQPQILSKTTDITKQSQHGRYKSTIQPQSKKQTSKQFSSQNVKNSLNESKTFGKFKINNNQDKLNKSLNSPKIHKKIWENCQGNKGNTSMGGIKGSPVREKKKVENNGISKEIQKDQQKQLQNKKPTKPKKQNTNKSISLHEKPKDMETKPRLMKSGRMQIAKQIQLDTHHKNIALNERSHSRDKNITLKKIIGKFVSSEPFLIDPSKIVFCSWSTLSSILTEKGAEGRIEYFSYGKNCIYIANSSIKGIHSLKEIVELINSGVLR